MAVGLWAAFAKVKSALGSWTLLFSSTATISIPVESKRRNRKNKKLVEGGDHTLGVKMHYAEVLRMFF